MVAGLFGVTGAAVSGYKVAKRTAQVEDFSFSKIGFYFISFYYFVYLFTFFFFFFFCRG